MTQPTHVSGTIKPLEWHKSHVKPWKDDYHTVPTGYVIRWVGEYEWKWSSAGGFGYSTSPEAAKAAAQADYEARIAAQIQPDAEPQASEAGELLPCPFCGSDPERITIGDEDPSNAGGDVISCTGCLASSHVEFGRKENLESCWNRRALPAARAEVSVAEAAGVLLDKMGDDWGRAVNAMTPILRDDQDETAWNTVSEMRDAFIDALRALTEVGE